MQIASILFLLAIGVVAVSAKKGSSEEDDRDYDVFSVWPYPRPYNSPKPIKFKPGKGKFQAYVISAPGFPFNRPQQQQQLPAPPAFPQMAIVEMQKFFESIQRQMQEFSEKAYNEFQLVEVEIENNRKALEKSLTDRLESAKESVLAKQAKQVEQAAKDGKDQEKIESCIKDQVDDFKNEMEDDVKRVTACISDATERARQALSTARNAFTEKSVMSALQAKGMAMRVAGCVQRRDAMCAQDQMAAINRVAVSTAQEGLQQIQRVKEAPQKQMIQLNYCGQNFVQDIRDLRGEYNDMLNKCTNVTEGAAKPSEDEDEDEDEEDDDIENDIEGEVEDEGENENLE